MHCGRPFYVGHVGQKLSDNLLIMNILFTSWTVNSNGRQQRGPVAQRRGAKIDEFSFLNGLWTLVRSRWCFFLYFLCTYVTWSSFETCRMTERAGGASRKWNILLGYTSEDCARQGPNERATHSRVRIHTLRTRAGLAHAGHTIFPQLYLVAFRDTWMKTGAGQGRTRHLLREREYTHED